MEGRGNTHEGSEVSTKQMHNRLGNTNTSTQAELQLRERVIQV